MSDFFFGKRGRAGISDRATVESRHEVKCFLHIFNNCSQNSFAILSIIVGLELHHKEIQG